MKIKFFTYFTKIDRIHSLHSQYIPNLFMTIFFSILDLFSALRIRSSSSERSSSILSITASLMNCDMLRLLADAYSWISLLSSGETLTYIALITTPLFPYYLYYKYTFFFTFVNNKKSRKPGIPGSCNAITATLSLPKEQYLPG